MRFRFMLAGAVLFAVPGIASAAQSGDRIGAVRQIAADVGYVLGAASACREISQQRIKAMTDKLTELIKASAASDEEFASIRQTYSQSSLDGQRIIAAKQIGCAVADRNLANLERNISSPQPAPAATGAFSVQAQAAQAQAAPLAVPSPASAVTGASPPSARSATVTAAPQAPASAVPPFAPLRAVAAAPAAATGVTAPMSAATNIASTRGITNTEIRFGVAAPFSAVGAFLTR